MKRVLTAKAGLKEVPRVQRFANRPRIDAALRLNKLASKLRRNRAIGVAHLKHGYTLSEIGSHLGLHYTTVSKVVNQVGQSK